MVTLIWGCVFIISLALLVTARFARKRIAADRDQIYQEIQKSTHLLDEIREKMAEVGNIRPSAAEKDKRRIESWGAMESLVYWERLIDKNRREAASDNLKVWSSILKNNPSDFREWFEIHEISPRVDVDRKWSAAVEGRTLH